MGGAIIQDWEDAACAGFAVVDAADDSFLGFCALVRIDAEGGKAEIGYITLPRREAAGSRPRPCS